VSRRPGSGAGVHSAAEVADAFLRAYAAGQARYPDDAWRRLWTSSQPRYWDEFLLAPGPPKLWDGAAWQERSVLQATAGQLALEYVAGAPFNVDGVLGTAGARRIGTLPVPIVVAVEEEENVTKFDAAIARLHLVRCPIKVGITYVAWGRDYGSDDEMEDGQEQRRETYQARIAASVAKIAEIANQHTLEDSRIEYVILLGVEKLRFTYEWYRLSFNAGDGVSHARWRRA
jgi:hypothetical protein